MLTKASRTAYLIAAGLLTAGIVTQVFLVGLSLLGQRLSWREHMGLGHFLGLFVLLMVVAAYTGRLPGSIKRLTWLDFGVYLLLADVVIFLRGSIPVVTALHPVLALTLFAITLVLVRRAYSVVASSGAAEELEAIAQVTTGD